MDQQSAELAEQIHSLAIRLLRRLRAAEGEPRLSGLRLSALSSLVELGPSSVGRLAANERVPAPTMSRQVTTLERAGWVARQPPPEDGGRERVKITPAGIRALEDVRTRRVQRLARLLEEVGGEEREALIEAAGIVERALRQPVG